MKCHNAETPNLLLGLMINGELCPIAHNVINTEAKNKDLLKVTF